MMLKIYVIEREKTKCSKGLSFSKPYSFVKCKHQNFVCFLTGRLHFVNDCRFQFLMDLFENVDRQCKRTTLVRKSSQNVTKNKLCLTIESLFGQVE